MNHIFNLLFEQYSGYDALDIILEIVAVVFGVLSVWFSKENKIWVFPTGIISTAIFVYLLYKWTLLGDMMINAYYFVVSIYGWFIWTRKVDNDHYTPVTYTTTREKWISVVVFGVTLGFVYYVYEIFDKWTSWTAYVDTFTTAIFFVGMWLMAKRKVENWIFWIVGDLISIPLYFYKGLTFTSMQYIGFTVLAVYGFLAWKKIINKNLQVV